jgi:hypothetical protein
VVIGPTCEFSLSLTYRYLTKRNDKQSRATGNTGTTELAHMLPDRDSDKIAKEVLSIHELLTQPIEGNEGLTAEMLEGYFTSLLDKLQKKSMAALEFVIEDLKVAPIRIQPVHDKAVQIKWKKVDVARGLVEWVSWFSFFLSNSLKASISEETQALPIRSTSCPDKRRRCPSPNLESHPCYRSPIMGLHRPKRIWRTKDRNIKG